MMLLVQDFCIISCLEDFLLYNYHFKFTEYVCVFVIIFSLPRPRRTYSGMARGEGGLRLHATRLQVTPSIGLS